MSAGLSLYVIAQEHRQMVERLLEFQDDAQAIEDTIAAESYPLEIKAQSAAYAAKTLEANADAIEAAAADMLARAKAQRNRAKSIRDYMLTCMDIAGVQRIECPHFVVKIASNPASVDVFEPGLVPADFMRQPEPPPPAPDKTKIKEALKAGQDVPGARLVQGKRLDIR